MKWDSKKGLEGICEIGAGIFLGLMCKYSINGFLYYQDAYNKVNGFENAGDAAGCLFLSLLAVGVGAPLCYDGIRKLYKSVKYEK